MDKSDTNYQYTIIFEKDKRAPAPPIVVLVSYDSLGSFRK